jgi:hypothetical protein
MSLEDLPHISEALQKTWRTAACQRYLQQLLRDNRNGTRAGFPFSVIDEILTLAAILEEDLGPCPADGEPGNATLDRVVEVDEARPPAERLARWCAIARAP